MTERSKTTIAIGLSICLFAVAGVVNHRLSVTTRSHRAEGGAPPPVHLASVFLGGFRGLITDGLWIRASMLQEQGRFLELVQLANWITLLEPEFPQVWALQAWNMAYNISVLMPDTESRWQWINNGLILLRDRAIPATGTNPSICLELSQLFLHKIGGPGDEYADWYRQRWITDIIKAIGHGDATPTSDFSVFEAKLNMDAKRMQAIEQKYGKVDWRLPESQALYWAHTGLTVSTAPGTSIRCRRMIYQSMAALFEKGELTVEMATRVMVMATDFDLLSGVLHAFEEALPTDPVASEAYANFLRRAILQLASFDRKTEAKRCFDILQQKFPSAETQAGFDYFTSRKMPMMPKIINIPTESKTL